MNSKVCAKLIKFEEQFLKFLKSIRKAENTILSYRTTLVSFIDYVEQYNDKVDIKDLNMIFFSEFLNYKTETLLVQVDKNGKFVEAAASSQNLYINHLTRFFKFVSTNYKDMKSFDYKNTLSELKISLPEREPKGLDQSEVEKVLQTLELNIKKAHEYDISKSRAKDKEQEKKNKLFLAYRNSLMFKIYVFSGIRASALIEKRVSQFRLDDDLYEFSIIKKGNKQVKAIVSASRIEKEFNFYKENGYDIIAMSTKNKNRSINRSEIWKVLRKLYSDSSVKAYGIHSLRHTFALDLYRKTKDIVTVKEVLHHSSTQTTNIYAKESEETIKNNYRKAIC